MCLLDNDRECAPATTYMMLVLVYNSNPQYLAFLLVVLVECVFASMMLTFAPPITPVDWSMAGVDTVFLALFLARVFWTMRIFKRGSAFALWCIIVGAAIMATLLALTRTGVAEAFVLMSLLFQCLFLVAAIELHGLFEDRVIQI
jgi:hypothetical protein